MKVILMRHGKPGPVSKDMIGADSFRYWINEYDAADLDPLSEPNASAIIAAKDADLIFCSDLPRSISSAVKLTSEKIVAENSLFREAGMPYGKRHYFNASPSFWLVAFRLLWFLGYSYGSESRKELKNRAKRAVQEFNVVENNNQCVLIVGHGIFNRFLANQLLSEGFYGPKTPNSNYWGMSVYQQT